MEPFQRFVYDDSRRLQQTADYAVRSGNTSFPVHKAFLQRHSDYFCIAVTQVFRESSENVTTVSDEHEVEVVATVLGWIYTNTYDNPYDQVSSQSKLDHAEFELKLYILAEYWQMSTLKLDTSKAFKTSFQIAMRGLSTHNNPAEGVISILKLALESTAEEDAVHAATVDIFQSSIDLLVKLPNAEEAMLQIAEHTSEPKIANTLDRLATICGFNKGPFKCPTCCQVIHFSPDQSAEYSYCHICGEASTREDWEAARLKSEKALSRST